MKKEKYEKYVGQKFGRLTVIDVTEKRNKHGVIIYRCMCECGNEKETVIGSLTSGKTKSCGCLLMKNLAGKVFGNLQVIAPTEKRRHESVIWHCKCACGADVEVSSQMLVHGKTRSCGCLLVKNIAGEIFGKLRAISPTEKRSEGGRDIFWNCICECGNETKALAGELKSGRLKSCGCLKTKDITGKKFGRLQAIAPVRKREKDNRIIWKCKCDCGNEREVTVTDLNRGATVSCGCLRKSDLVGQRFGRLRVIAPTEKRSTGNSLIWNCECDCGNKAEVTTPCLKNGDTKSCGCWAKDNIALRQATMDTKARSTNKSTGIRNISYSEKRDHFTVGIIREGKRFSQCFDTLGKALHAKEIVFERYKRKEVNWYEKL